MIQEFTVKMDVPDGYKIIDYRKPVTGDLYLWEDQVWDYFHPRFSRYTLPHFILEKIKPPHKWPELVYYIDGDALDTVLTASLVKSDSNAKHLGNYGRWDLIMLNIGGCDSLYLGHWNDGLPEEDGK